MTQPATLCAKCGREIELKLSEKSMKWTPYDKLLKKKHTQCCHNGEPKFKTYDYVIAFWLKSVAHYKITSLSLTNLEYVFLDKTDLASPNKVLKTVDFITAEKFCKKMDNIYALLYL